MTIDEQTIRTLEFSKICEQLARYTSFSASKELALMLRPDTDAHEVARRLRLTGEAGRFLDEFPDATIGGARDVRPAVDLAERGGVLEPGTLLEIVATLGSMRRLRTMLGKLSPEHFPLLTDYTEALPYLLSLEDEITNAIGDDGMVLDRASPALHRLRSQITQAASRLHDRLHSLITSPKFASALQEPLVTVRNGRHVVPVKVEQRRVIPGLVHDQSASGATLYVEPMSVVDLNNHWHECQIAEQQEIERILAALSDRVGSEGVLIRVGVDTLALLDLAFARSRYALALRCVEPELVTEPLPPDQPESAEHAPLSLVQARHPLLNQSTVVPIDVWLGGAFRILLITGPNTGGKTVALKTVGLLALMAQAGLHIPANHPARLPVFSQIFADIGDEQSIEQSLSTFSSHMTTIIRILAAIEQHAPTSAEPTLVLLDEIGAGTDPVEGSALAGAIIHRLLARGCLGILTTHYAELKAFAHTTEGIQNASVEFDIETLAPTYRLMVGLPGRSNALAIAARLGLDPALIELARSTVTHEDAEIEDLLADIHRQREATGAAMQRAQELREDAQKYRDRLAQELRDLEDARQDRIEEAYQQAEHDLRDVRAEMHRLRDELRHTAQSRQSIQQIEQSLETATEELGQKKQQEIKKQSAETQQRTQQEDGESPFKVGDTVLVRSVGLEGELLSIDEEDLTADVQVGGFRMNVDLRELRRETATTKKARRSLSYSQSAPQTTPSLPAAPDVSMHFDMRGWRAAEASDRLDRYLNDAYLAGLAQVHLIHGKGSGVLRQVVRDIVRKHPLVASFSKGGSDADDGMTVVKLVER